MDLHALRFNAVLQMMQLRFQRADLGREFGIQFISLGSGAATGEKSEKSNAAQKLAADATAAMRRFGRPRSGRQRGRVVA